MRSPAFALVLLALVASVPAASAAPSDPCERVACPTPVLQVYEDRACVGYAWEFGGSAACWFAQRPTCVTRYFVNAYQETCVDVPPFSGPDHPCDRVSFDCPRDPCAALALECPPARPVYQVDTEHACAGVAFQVGGTAACWYVERPACVTWHVGYAYTEVCPADAVDLRP